VGPDEDIVGQGDAFVESRKVLNLAVVAYNDINVDVHILPDVAAFANAGSLADLNPMPDPSPVADGRRGRDFCGGMNRTGHGSQMSMALIVPFAERGWLKSKHVGVKLRYANKETEHKSQDADETHQNQRVPGF